MLPVQCMINCLIGFVDYLTLQSALDGSATHYLLVPSQDFEKKNDEPI